MSEIYWLTRLDCVKNLIGYSIVFAVIGLAIGIAYMIANIDRDYESEKQNFKIGKKITKICASIAIILGLAACFIPNTHDAYMIYGVGGTIEYIKSNETVKQLPDKCIHALDKYLDELNKED